MAGSAGCARAPAVDLRALPPPAATCSSEGCTTREGPGRKGACPGDDDRPCGGAVAQVCTERALSLWSESRAQGALACVAAMLADACELDDARACSFAGRLWLDGHGVARDPERGMAMLLHACDGGFATACVVGGRALAESDEADVKDLLKQRARFDLEQACWSGQADSCYRAGLFFYFGREEFPRDVRRATKLYERGCNLGDSRACNNLGDAFAYGDGVSRDVERAASLFERACRLGEALGCANLGYMAEHGEGVARDEARARSLYRDACTTGDVYGCIHSQMMAAQAEGAPRDPDRALAHWREGCDRRRDANACAFVGILYEDGPDGLSRDEAKSAEAMSQACELGNDRACDWIKARGDDD